ncbi:MAG: adenosylcobinamide-GDP ribazoletransferase [Victivallales bacterium]|nr:adenosylcobinamide-GDP ribazoletransferase [Victivallales bacterium]
MSKIFENFKLSLSLLTRIPVNNLDIDKADWTESCAFFPGCGYIIAILTIFPGYFLYLININASPLLLASWSVLCLIITTGAMHLDGFADICDGFGSHAGREKRLEIMHDPRVGSFGVTGIIILLILKFSAFSVIYRNKAFFQASAVIVLARMLLVFAAHYFKPSENKGLGSLIIGKVSKKTFLISFTLTLPCLFFINTIAALFIMTAIMLYLVKISYRYIGGINGDVLGAVCEISETTGLFTVAILCQF